MNNEWVTDPQAIDVIISIGELRPGDEVMVHYAKCVALSMVADGTVLKVEKMLNQDTAVSTHTWREGGFQVPFPIVCYARGYFVQRNIKAWRRPK